MYFCVFNFFQQMNENKSTWGIIVVKSKSFVRFLEESSAWKNHFDFVWPLPLHRLVDDWLCLRLKWSLSYRSSFPILFWMILTFIQETFLRPTSTLHFLTSSMTSIFFRLCSVRSSFTSCLIENLKNLNYFHNFQEMQKSK